MTGMFNNASNFNSDIATDDMVFIVSNAASMFKAMVTVYQMWMVI